MNSPDQADPDALIPAIRARLTVTCQRHSTWAGRPASKNQITTVNIALRQIIGDDRADRIRVLHAIFPEGVERLESGEICAAPLWSSKNLTFAQAWVLMELLYRLTDKDSFYVGRPLYQRAIDFFTEMVEWTKQPKEQLVLL